MPAAVPFLYVLRKRSQRFEQMRQFLPEALDLMVSAIRAGHSFSSAMGMASKESPEPVRREFRQCFEEQNYGLELRAALSNLEYRMPIGEVRMIVTAVLIQSESGGNLTEILEKSRIPDPRELPSPAAGAGAHRAGPDLRLDPDRLAHRARFPVVPHQPATDEPALDPSHRPQADV